MSRIGKKPIPLPDKVKVDIQQDAVVVTGPKGTVTNPIPPGIRFEQKDKQVHAIRQDDSGPQRADGVRTGEGASSASSAAPGSSWLQALSAAHGLQIVSAAKAIVRWVQELLWRTQVDPECRQTPLRSGPRAEMHATVPGVPCRPSDCRSTGSCRRSTLGTGRSLDPSASPFAERIVDRSSV